MQNVKDEDELKRRSSPINQPENALSKQGNDDRQTDSAAARTDDDNRRGRSNDITMASKAARKPGESTAALLRRSSRLPRPTVSAPSGEVGSHQSDEISSARRTRRLSTLQGVVINSPTYSTTRPTAGLVASVISKCRIPAPVTTRRISSWTDCGDSRSPATQNIRSAAVDAAISSASEYNSRTAGSRTLNVGDSSTCCAADPSPRNSAGNAASSACTGHGTTPAGSTRNSAQCSSDSGKQSRHKHVCCGCAGTGLVSSHLLCIRPTSGTVDGRARGNGVQSRSRRTSPRPGRVYRFNASARHHHLAVAQLVVEAGLQSLPPEARHLDMASDRELAQTSSGYERNSKDQTACGQADDDLLPGETLKRDLAVGGKLPNSKLLPYERSVTEIETESKQNAKSLISSPARREPSRKKWLERGVADCQNESGKNCASSEAAETESKPSKFVTSTGRDAPLHFTFSDHRSPRSVISATEDERPQTERSANGRKLATRFPWRDLLVTTPFKPPPLLPRQECLEANTTSRQNLSDKMAGQMTSLPISEFRSVDDNNIESEVRLEKQRDVKTYMYPTSVVEANSIENVENPHTAEDLVVREQTTISCVSTSVPHATDEHLRSTLAATPSFFIGIPLPLSLDDCRCKKRPRSCTENSHTVEPTPSFISCSASEKDSTHASARQKNTAETLPMRHKTSAAKNVESASVHNAKRVSAASNRQNTSKNIAVREQTTFSCLTNVFQRSTETPQHLPSTQPCFTGIPLPPFLQDNYQCKKRRIKNSDNVEPIQSFILCSASERNSPQTSRRQKTAADMPPMRRKIFAPKNVESASTNSDNKSSATPKRCSVYQPSSLRSLTVDDRSSLLSRQNRNRNLNSSKLKTATCKSICQRKSESLQKSSATAKHTTTSVRTSRIKRSPLTFNATEKSRQKSQNTKDVHSKEEPTEFRKRTVSSCIGPTNRTFAQKADQPKCTTSEKKSTESDMKISRMKYRPLLRELTQANKFSGKTQFAHKNTSVVDSTKVKTSDEVGLPFVPLAHSTCPTDELSNDMSSEGVKQPVSFFISFPSASQSKSHAEKSRIPRPQTSFSSLPTKSDSYIVRTNVNGTQRLSTGTERHPASEERRSTNASPSSTSTFLLHPDDCGDHPATLTLEPEMSKTHNDTADQVCNTIELNCAESSQYQDADSSEPQRVENHEPPQDNVSLNVLSTGKISNLIAQDPAVANGNGEKHSRSMFQTKVSEAAPAPQNSTEPIDENLEQSADDAAVNPASINMLENSTTQDASDAINEEHSTTQITSSAVANVPHKISEEIPQPMQLSNLSNHSFTLPDKPNFERLLMKLHDGLLQYSSNTDQRPSNTPLNAVCSSAEISNVTTQDQPIVAAEIIEERSSSLSQCTDLEGATAVAQKSPEYSKQSPQLALSGTKFISSAEPNIDEFPVKSSSDQLGFSSISAVNDVNAVECTDIDHEAGKLHETAVDALEMCTILQPAPETRTSKKSPRSQSAETAVENLSLNIGLEVRLQTFDDVDIQLPDVFWSRVQSEEFHRPEALARLYQPIREAIVLRNAVRNLQTSSRRRADRPRRTQFPSRSLATAERARDVVDPSAVVSINVATSQIDRAIQSVDTAFQLTSPDLSGQAARTTGMRTDTDALSSYSPVKRYLEQFAAERTSTEQLSHMTKASVVPPAPTKRESRQPGHRYQRKNLLNADTYKRENKVKREKRDKEQNRRQTSALQFTQLREVKSGKNQIDVNSKCQGRLKLARSDLGPTADQADAEKNDDNQLPVDKILRMEKSGDSKMISDKELPVLAAKARPGSGEQHQGHEVQSEDREIDVDKLSSGELY